MLACTDQAAIPQPLTTDQRGFTRPDPGDVPPACDVGAYESNFANDLILNTSTVQVVHNIGSPTDVLNMALNVTSNETPCGTSGCPLLPFDFDVNPYVEHDIGSSSYGTFFRLNGGGAVASKIVRLATPPGTCGTWSINLHRAELIVDIEQLGRALSERLRRRRRMFHGQCASGHRIVKPHHGVRRIRR